MNFTLTKTTCSQRGELFAKSDFHESIRRNAKVLCLRNSESCNLSRSVHLARRAMYTERSLRAATRFFAANQQKKLKEKCRTFQIKVSSLHVRRASYFRRFPLCLRRCAKRVENAKKSSFKNRKIRNPGFLLALSLSKMHQKNVLVHALFRDPLRKPCR